MFHHFEPLKSFRNRVQDALKRTKRRQLKLEDEEQREAQKQNIDHRIMHPGSPSDLGINTTSPVFQNNGTTRGVNEALL